MTRELISILRVFTISRVRNRIFSIKFCYYFVKVKKVLRIASTYKLGSEEIERVTKRERVICGPECFKVTGSMPSCKPNHGL